jgi:ATP-dependent phosphoenolpyruvate carboxykinase
MCSSTSIVTSLTHKEIIILGTLYAGESKKGIWT